MTPICPRCLVRSADHVTMSVAHSCPDLDRVCSRCGRALYVDVELVDARGSYSVCAPCGCFIAPAPTPTPARHP